MDAFLHLCRRFPLGAIGAVICVVFVLSAALANVISPHDPLQTNAALSLKAPNTEHVMGADFMGRDMLSRIIHGARISLAVGVFSVLLGWLLLSENVAPSVWAALVLVAAGIYLINRRPRVAAAG